MLKAPRAEAQILEDLKALATSPGYAHAMAQICHRDSYIAYSEHLKPKDLEKLFGTGRLIRTEVTTLLGLMVQGPVSLNEPAQDECKAYVDRTDVLMEELHNAMSYPMLASILEAAADPNSTTAPDVWDAKMMREPIFYGGEAAFSFQYRDLLPEKYSADDAWLLKNKGFTSTQAQQIALTMCRLMDEKATVLNAEFRRSGKQPSTWLSAFEFTASEVAHRSGVQPAVVDAFMAALTLTGNNGAFKEIGDYNGLAGAPLIPTNRGTVLLFQQYAIYEALYESPYFWMRLDEDYLPTSQDHRGAFVEEYSARRLAGVFGREHVHTNVNIHRGKKTVGEMDVLVLFGDRAIIVQCKAKKLTIQARKGNDGQLKKDFGDAIQAAYDQGWKCANELVAGGCTIEDAEGKVVSLPGQIKEIHLFTMLAEHYPAMAFQAHQFLKYQSTDVIRPPFVMDVFLLDTMTEMLNTPLRLLSYAQLRTSKFEEITLSHELTALAYHLRRNLWLDSDHDMVHLDDSINLDLEAAMTVRRENMPGERTPPGILTHLAGTYFERLIRTIEGRPEPATLELGLGLLKMSENSARNVHRGLDTVTRMTKADGQRHDFTLGTEGVEGGFTFHCNAHPTLEAVAALESYCTRRKYANRANRWFGVSVDVNSDVQFGVTLESPWEQSDEMDRVTAGMKKARRVAEVMPQMVSEARKLKVGRNSLCPCQSGKKYKRCCLP